MSQNICSDCAEELLQAYKFREKCSSSEQTLIDFKAGLVKIEERDENIFACKSDVTMIHHDYSHNLGEEDVKNVTKVKCRQSKSQQENKKRFYLLERRLGDKKSVKLKEIDEANVKNLLNRNSALMKVNSRFRDVVAGVLPHGITMNDVMKDMILRNALIRNLNKRKMMIYTHITRPAANSIITSNSMIRKKSKALREQNKNPDQSSKPNDEESGIPTTSENAQELHNTTDECIQSVKAKNLYSNIYTCQYCKKIYRDKQQLKKHIERDHEMIEDHEKTENHTCKRCGQCFSTQNDLFVHQKKHSKGDYICKLCQAYFATLEAFVDHKKTSHDEKKAHCCEFCGQFFDYSGALRYHKNRAHLKGMRTFCQICDQGFRFKSTLARHMATHSTLQFDCKLCNKTFKKRDRLLDHIKSQHPGTDEDTNEEDEIKKLECDYCDKICYNKQSYSVHVWENHEGSVCIYCDTRLESAQELEEHLEAKHRDISDFSCRYCGKCYPELNILESHLDMHRVRFHQCEICHKRFSDASRLKIHMNTHTSNKLYECQYCEKTFRYITSRVIHERVHTGERPYVCDICGKGFACQSTRKRHGETHTSRSMNE